MERHYGDVANSTPEPSPLQSPAAGAAAVRGSALVSGSYVISLGLSLIAVPLLSRHLGTAGFGRYSTVLALATVIGGLTDSGMVNIALREWSTQTGEDRQRAMRTLLGIRLELGIVGVLLGVLYALVAGFEQAMVVGTILAGTGTLMQILADLLAIGLQGDLRFGWSALIGIARQVLSVALIVGLVLAGAGIVPFLAVAIPANLLALLMTAVVVRGRMPLRPALRAPGGWALLRDTLPFSAALAISAVYFQVTILVMHQIASPLQTGYFSLSFRVIQILIAIPALAIGASFPILSHSAQSDSERFRYAAGRVLELALIAAAPLVLAVVLGAPFIIAVLKDHAAPAIPVLRIQALILLANFVSTASAFLLLSVRKHFALLVGNLTGLAVNIALSLLLIPSLHAQGAAISGVIAESCLAIGQLLFALRDPRVRLRLSTLGVVAVAGAAGIAPLFIPDLFSVVKAIIGVAVYCAVIAALGRLPEELVHLWPFRRAGNG
jgi:O-antigen/teichoic acid export membrane protein